MIHVTAARCTSDRDSGKCLVSDRKRKLVGTKLPRIMNHIDSCMMQTLNLKKPPSVFTSFVSVLEKPSFLSHPSDMTAEVGGIISLQCKATGDPAPRYQWRKDGEIFQAGEGYNTDTLTLDGVIPNDAGQYYCEAINAVGRTQSKTVVIKVVGTYADFLGVLLMFVRSFILSK